MTDQPEGELRIRSKEEGVQVTGVNFPQRLIELIVTPYEEMTLVPYNGRMVKEVFSRGAYDGIQRRAGRIKVLRDHDAARPVGRALALHPSREEGLVAEIKIARTELGEETLTLAEDGILDASAGFLPMPDGEEWNRDRTEVRIRRAWLGHVGLVSEPAYESARVLSVRQGGSQGLAQRTEEHAPTPNLDLIRAWRLQEQFDRLERR